MPNNLCIIEDLEDYSLFKKNINFKDYIVVPLSFETFLECKKSKLKIINFDKYLNKSFHKKALDSSVKFSNGIKFFAKTEYSLKNEIVSRLRFRLHSIIFMIELIEPAIKDLKVEKILVSGISRSHHAYLQNWKISKISSEIIYNLFKTKFESLLEERNQNKNDPKLYEYISNSKLKKDRKKILMSNGGYNFSRLSKIFKKKFDIECWIMSFQKISFLKKIYYKFFKSFNVVYFEKKNQLFNSKKIFIHPVNFIYKHNFDLSEIINLFNSKLLFYFNDLNQKILAVKKKIKNENFNLTISNITRGLDGSILDKDVEVPSLCISHGIISKGINKHDEIYKKMIAEAVFSGDSKYFSIQSKIMNESLKSHQILGKGIITGNIVFAKANKSEKKNIFCLPLH